MSERYINLYESEDAYFLLKNNHKALVLLMLIAFRARRISGLPDGLQIGDAIIGDYETCGLTRQEYRTALGKLVELGLVEIVYNGKLFLKREKSTIKITIKGMLVNLCDRRVFDINSEDVNQQDNQRATNSQPTANHKEERIRKNKNEKEEEKNTKKESPELPLATSLLTEFYQSLLKSIPNFSEDKCKHTQAQLAAMQRLVIRHGEHKVKEVFSYAHQSDFWKAHVHTATYLEKKFETLTVQMTNPQSQNIKKDRKFAPCSDDQRALGSVKEMGSRAI